MIQIFISWKLIKFWKTGENVLFISKYIIPEPITHFTPLLKTSKKGGEIREKFGGLVSKKKWIVVQRKYWFFLYTLCQLLVNKGKTVSSPADSTKGL